MTSKFRDEKLQTYQEMADYIKCSRSYFCRKILPQWREVGIIFEAPRMSGNGRRRMFTYKQMVKFWLIMKPLE